MALSVRQVLALPIVERARARVVAGSAGLDRPVRWAHAAELSDIATLLNGGELLLTTGMGLRSSGPEERRRYVRQLSDAGIAALAVELGRSFSRIPTDMIDTAEQLALPLIALERETRFVEITEHIHRAIINRQNELLGRVEAINREFGSLLLAGDGVEQILHRLAEVLGNPVVLENATHQVVGYAPQDSRAIDAILDEWAEHSRTGHADATGGSVQYEGDPPRGCMWMGIWLRHERWGRIHVVTQSTPPLGDAAPLVLDRAAVAIGLSALAQSDAEQLADRAASSVITDLLTGRYGSTHDLFVRARNLGSDLSTGALVAVIVDARNLARLATERRLSERERQAMRAQLRSELRGALTRMRCVSLLGLDGDRVLGVVAVPDSRRMPQTLQHVAVALRHRLDITQPDLTVVIGASTQSPPDGLRRAFEEARIAIEFGHGKGTDMLYQFGNLGTYPLLAQLARGPELAAFVESELGGLLQHDASAKTKLMPTLKTYLANVGHKAQTAHVLRIQRRTLYARLTLIEEIIGRGLDTDDSRTRLTLALQGREVVESRATRT